MTCLMPVRQGNNSLPDSKACSERERKQPNLFTYFKQLLDNVLVISGIIKVKVGVISQVEGLG